MIFGYLDPVTGSAIFQVLLGALAAAGLGWQYIRKYSKAFWAKVSGGESIPPSDTAAAESEHPVS